MTLLLLSGTYYVTLLSLSAFGKLQSLFVSFCFPLSHILFCFVVELYPYLCRYRKIGVVVWLEILVILSSSPNPSWCSPCAASPLVYMCAPCSPSLCNLVQVWGMTLMPRYSCQWLFGLQGHHENTNTLWDVQNYNTGLEGAPPPPPPLFVVVGKTVFVFLLNVIYASLSVNFVWYKSHVVRLVALLESLITCM